MQPSFGIGQVPIYIVTWGHLKSHISLNNGIQAVTPTLRVSYPHVMRPGDKV